MQIRKWKDTLAVVGLCFCFALFDLSFASAGTGDKNIWPFPRNVPGAGRPVNNANPGFSTKSGLKIEVDTRGVGERGFRRVGVTVSAATPVPADRQITFRFSARSGYNRSTSISVEKDFELQQGTSAASANLTVPQFLHWDRIDWEVWVDGVKDEELSFRDATFSHSANNYLISAVGLPVGIKRNWSRARTKYLNSERIDEVLLEEFPTRWTELSTADVAVLTPKELQALGSSYPDSKRALLRWVRAGGNLWFVAGSDSYEALSMINQQLGLKEVQDSRVRWQALPLEGAETRGIDALLRLTSDTDGGIKPTNIGGIEVGRSDDQDSFEFFISRSYGLGTVTLFKGHFDYDVQGQIDMSMLSERLYWPRRHGNDPANSNLDFNNFLIPDVGLAPVFEFQFLITLFVLGIGPLNYWLLKRSGKIPMLLATVPAAALATTFLLFAYGFLSEGVGTRVRARSFTFLDQPASEASSWARLSYYAGVAPSEGLSVPNDTAVYPILPASTNRRTIRRYANQWREVELDEPEARFTEGWLPSRTPTQYLSITARATENRLRISKNEEQLKVTNNLGVECLYLAIRDEAGQYYLATGFKDGASMMLNPTGCSDVSKVIREQFLENEPIFPAGGDIRGRRTDNQLRLDQGLLETQIKAIGTLTSKEWAKQTYVAITATGIEVELGLESVQENHSFHVVKGVWQYD